ncbi:MAG: class I SAM-dependent methyltransferase [Rhodobacteraceae bacterium]|nr:MAG: class I SAM-dependent methyltransferase [Paracoccaceae bacterium]
MIRQDRNRRFWNRIADRYAARQLKDLPAYEAMLQNTAARLSSSDRVLEIGCGTGGTAIRLAPGVAEWIATDFSQEMVRIARAKPSGENVRFKVADAAEALTGGPYDAICAFNVLHLVDDLPAILARVHASLHPNGQLISKTWCFAEVSPWLRVGFRVLRTLGLFPVARSLTQAQLRQAMRDAGFEITEQRVFGAYPQNPYIVAQRPMKPET